jgi:hypothetical protein
MRTTRVSQVGASQKEGAFNFNFSTFFTTFSAVMLGIVLGLFSTVTFAVDNNGVFELDGNADDEIIAGDDWDTLYGGGGSQTEFTFITDKNGFDDIFTGGGSKTPNDPEDWLWKSSPPPPDKDNITHAYAANYVYLSEQIIYFGADLFADNGDAELAFWFFQDKVATVGVGSGTFSGHHVDGDVYVAVKFSIGGTQANIAVFEWWAACDKAVKDPGTGDCARIISGWLSQKGPLNAKAQEARLVRSLILTTRTHHGLIHRREAAWVMISHRPHSSKVALISTKPLVQISALPALW